MKDERKDRATRAITWMRECIADGRTVYLTQYASRIEITPKLWARFEKAGKALFRASSDGLYIARGKHWDYVGYHKISAA